ncbi:MAG: UvrD-helicase domain-containing protein [Candidatus Methanoperedens sp.]
MTLDIQYNDIDNHVDDEIYDCLNLDFPKSFFLFAGAGSGKTRSLVNVLKRMHKENGQRLRMSRQQIGIITYTNAACDEIKRRLNNESIFFVSTIHSFVWELVRNYQDDIKEWLRNNIAKEIKDLKEQQLKGRSGKTASDREKKIESKSKRLNKLDEIKRFTYNPNGDNISSDSLNHSEVINIGAYFLLNKPLMQNILTRKFPILLIDESQDTKKELIDAFFAVQKNNSKHFSLGLFGDTMQRIYSDGKENLGQVLPEDWVKPVKKMNHRCPKRIITLINKIRSSVDKQEQLPRTDKEKGIVRFFIVPPILSDKIDIENEIAKKMVEITGDTLWSGSDSVVKTLTLEHHMAARRMGFIELFEPLAKADRLRTGLLDGTLPGIHFFTQLILPIIKAKQSSDEFAVARIVRQYSPLFDREIFKNSPVQIDIIKQANDSVTSLFLLWSNNADPLLIDIIRNIAKTGLFSIPESLLPIASRTENEQLIANAFRTAQEKDDEEKDDQIEAWDSALSNHFSQIEPYNDYVTDKAQFGTHQGVKGLEFPRVMVIIDDEEARGFLFSYEKLFGAKAPSDTDQKHIVEGKETSIDRTRRLLYVTCSRAKESLAIVAYSANPELIMNHVLKEGWFLKEEIEIFRNNELCKES